MTGPFGSAAHDECLCRLKIAIIIIIVTITINDYYYYYYYYYYVYYYYYLSFCLIFINYMISKNLSTAVQYLLLCKTTDHAMLGQP